MNTLNELPCFSSSVESSELLVGLGLFRLFWFVSDMIQSFGKKFTITLRIYRALPRFAVIFVFAADRLADQLTEPQKLGLNR